MPTITDWLMVGITLVYVVATIFICWANIKSAKATKEQVAEAKRQYEEEHRAYITYQIIYERRAFYGIRFTNHGKRVANHAKVSFNQDFIDSIEELSCSEILNKLRDKEFTLGIGQSYDLYFGTNKYRDNPNKKLIEGKIDYQDALNSYTEVYSIDFEQYATIFSVDSDADVLHEDMKKQLEAVKKISHELETLNYFKKRNAEEYKSEIAIDDT